MLTERKALLGIMRCGVLAGGECGGEKCPYWGKNPCKEQLLDDTQRIVQISIPRLINIKDFEAGVNTDEYGFLPAWAEYRVAKGLPRGKDGWAIINRDIFTRTNSNFKRYWTKKPDEQLAQETKWW